MSKMINYHFLQHYDVFDFSHVINSSPSIAGLCIRMSLESWILLSLHLWSKFKHLEEAAEYLNESFPCYFLKYYYL